MDKETAVRPDHPHSMDKETAVRPDHLRSIDEGFHADLENHAGTVDMRRIEAVYR